MAIRRRTKWQGTARKPNELPSLLTAEETAKLLKVHPATLGNWRVSGRGPRFVRIGRRVRYSVIDLESYVADRTKQSTSEP